MYIQREDRPDGVADAGGDGAPKIGDASTKPLPTPRTSPVQNAPQATRHPRWRRWLMMVVLSAAVIAVGFGANRWLVATKPPVAQRPTVEQAKPVRAMIAQRQDTAPTLTAFGQIVAGRSVDLRGLVVGEVVAVAPNFVEGGIVTEGAPLVTIDPFNYKAALVKARAELAEAEAQLAETTAKIAAERAAAVRAEEQRDIATREVERVADLSKRGNASVADLDTSRNRLLVAVAAMESRRDQIPILEAQRDRLTAALDRLRQAVETAQRDLARTQLVAPFGGVLSNIAAERGKTIATTDRVATLVDFSQLDVKFSLADADYGRFLAADTRLVGRAVIVNWRGGETTISRQATIERIAPVITAATGAVDVFARFPTDADVRHLRPGSFVTVTLEGPVLPGVLRVPQSALTPDHEVFVIGDDDRLTPVPVTIVGYQGDEAFIRANIAANIPDGARVMTTRLSEAGPGTLVTATMTGDGAKP